MFAHFLTPHVVQLILSDIFLLGHHLGNIVVHYGIARKQAYPLQP
jgi:hypothetical protein